ncbi:MAG: prepilin peptidase [Methyloligellaceae bacterium]
MVLELAVLAVFPALMAFAGAMDLFTMTIPNRVPLALVVIFFALAPFMGFDLLTLGQHVAVAAGTLVLGLFCFARGWIGGGDAKLFSATALWLGWEHLFEYTLVAAILGGLLTLVILFGRMMPLPAPLARQDWLARLHDTRQGVPYGIALAAGALLVYPHTAWMQLAG